MKIPSLDVHGRLVPGDADVNRACRGTAEKTRGIQKAHRQTSIGSGKQEAENRKQKTRKQKTRKQKTRKRERRRRKSRETKGGRHSMQRAGPTVQLTPIDPDLSRPRILRVSNKRYRPFCLPRPIRVLLTPVATQSQVSEYRLNRQAPKCAI
jgi:hypothetical protein